MQDGDEPATMKGIGVVRPCVSRIGNTSRVFLSSFSSYSHTQLCIFKRTLAKAEQQHNYLI